MSNFDHIVLGGGTGLIEILKCKPQNPECLSLTHSASLESKIDMLGSLRGKVGFVLAPNWLIYGTGGLAYAHVETTTTATESVAMAIPLEGGPTGTVSSFSGTVGTSMLGWAAGAGVDWKWQLDAGSALVFGVEYLHYGFPEHTITITDNAGGSFAFTGKENVDTRQRSHKLPVQYPLSLANHSDKAPGNVPGFFFWRTHTLPTENVVLDLRW